MLPHRSLKPVQTDDGAVSIASNASFPDTTSPLIDSNDVTNQIACDADTKNYIICPQTETSDEAAKKEIVTDEKMDVDSDEKEPSPDNATEYSMSSTKIDNLEHFPAGILLEIFDRTDEIGLLHLAETSHRFAALSKIFVINGLCKGGDAAIYRAQLNDIGSVIETIHIKYADNLGENHWAIKLLQPHIGHIKKLTFDSCSFKSKNKNIFSVPLNSVTQLTFRQHCSDVHKRNNNEHRTVHLPVCHNLTELEVHNTAKCWSFSWNSLEHAIRNNPMLQSLLLYGFSYTSLRDVLELIAENLKHIKKLALVTDFEWSYYRFEPDADNHIFKSLEHLESLDITVDVYSIEVLKFFGSHCKGIKHLGLLFWGGARTYAYFDMALMQATVGFRHIKSFHCYAYDPLEYDFNFILILFLCLRHLCIEPKYNALDCSGALSWIRDHRSLEKITMIFNYECEASPATFISAEFFKKFVDIANETGKSNAEIEVKERGQIIGSVNMNGTVWRNKLMHWKGCDKNETNIHLLDLSDHFNEAKNTKNVAEQTNLLDEICDYLDMDSLYSLAETSKQSQRLVNSYVKKHSNKMGTFTITDEFYSFESLKTWMTFDKFHLARYVTDLKVYIFGSKSKENVAEIIESCEHLEKLSIYDGCPQERWPEIQSDITHIVYDSPYFIGFAELDHLLDRFAGVETIEFKKAGLFDDFDPDKNDGQKFGQLKKFIFNYRGKAQTENLNKIFENTTLQLVPIF